MDNTTDTPSSKDKASTTWSRDDEWVLIRTLKKAKEDSKWGDNNPKEVAWRSCVIALSGSEKVSGGAKKSVKAIRNRWQRLKQEYEMIKSMRDQSGWGWDHEKNAPVVSDEVWNAYIEKLSNKSVAKPLCKKGFPLFEEFGELVDGTRATGLGAFRAGQPTPAPSTQNAAASASMSYEPVIDPDLLEMPSEKGQTLNKEVDHDVPRDDNSTNTTVNTPKKTFFEREAESFISTDNEGGPVIQKGKETPNHKRSASAMSTGNERRKVRRTSTKQEMDFMTDRLGTAIDKLSDKLASPEPTLRAPRSEALELATRAINAIETNEGLSPKDLLTAIRAVNDPTVANTYLSIQDEGVRRDHLLSEMEKIRRAN